MTDPCISYDIQDLCDIGQLTFEDSHDSHVIQAPRLTGLKYEIINFIDVMSQTEKSEKKWFVFYDKDQDRLRYCSDVGWLIYLRKITDEGYELKPVCNSVLEPQKFYWLMSEIPCVLKAALINISKEGCTVFQTNLAQEMGCYEVFSGMDALQIMLK